MYRGTYSNQANARRDGLNGQQRVQKPMLPQAKVHTANKLDVQNYTMPTIYLLIDKQPVRVHLDTGSASTFVDATFASQKLGKKGEDFERCEAIAVAAGQQPLGIVGATRLQLAYRAHSGQVRVIYVHALAIKDLGYNVLLGMDFVRRVKAIIDIKNGQIRCHTPEAIDTATLQPATLAFQQQSQVVEEGLPSNTAIGAAVQRGPSSAETAACVDEEGTLVSHNEANSYLRTAAIAIDDHEQLESCAAVDDTWGDCIPTLANPFADDQTEDRVNPYIYFERTKTLPIGGNELHVGSHLDAVACTELQAILGQFYEIFAFNGQLGECKVLECEIPTGNAKPINQALRLRPQREREAVELQVQQWLGDGVIRPSKSPWASNVVTVRKKDNTIRCCIDYRPLNSVTERDVYPLPTREEMLSCFTGMTLFSSLDLNQGYMQICINENDIAKTAFTVQSGFYEFTRMPFGLCNAPAAFQRTMDYVLAGLKYNACLVYLDDIIIFGRSVDEHNRNLVKVLQAIRDAGLTIKPSKCAFSVTEIKFIGHIISADGIAMDQDKINAIAQAKQPANVSDIRSFIGLASYYRCFVHDFARIARPLTDLTKKDVAFIWTEAQEETFNKLKSLLTSEPVLCHYDPRLPIELRTDACGYGLGAVLLHVFEDNKKRVICYASRLLDACERNYGITEKECLAIVWAVEKFRCYLLGIKFTVVTDHLALTWLKSKKDLQGRLMRWANRLQPFHFDVIYKSGKHHKDADHVSRFPINAISYGRRGTFNTKARDAPLTGEEMDVSQGADIELLLREAQTRDEHCQRVMAEIEKHPQFAIEDDLLVYIDFHDGRAEEVSKIVVPDTVLPQVLYTLHDDPMSGHGGGRKTLNRFKQRYYTKSAAAKVKSYVKTCHSCQTRKQPWTRKFGLLQPIEPARAPFERIGIDIVGPFKRNERGNRKLILITDYMTRWAIARAVPRATHVEVADMIIQEVILKHGAPKVILSDRDKVFRKDVLRNIYAQFEISHVTATAWHPQTNGLTERLNKTLIISIAMYARKHEDWDLYVPYAVFAYNTAWHHSTGYTPFYLLYGSEARMLVDIAEPQTEVGLAEHFERLYEARQDAIEQTRKAQACQKQQYDKARREQSFEIGDKVLVYRTRGYTGQTTKLRHPFEGPFQVVEKLSDLNYRVKDLSGCNAQRDMDIVHVSRMRRYYGRANASITNSKVITCNA